MSNPSCFPSDNKYLDYKCYNRLYKYFNDDHIFRNNEEKLEIISPKIDIKPYHREEQRQIFNKLYQYMGGDSVFGWENQTECCKYVNYWLNDKVEKNIIALYDEKSFKIFQDIVQLYNKNNPGKTKCISDIKFIDTEYLRRMGALYSLYDKYYSLISNTIRCPYKPCDLIDQASGIFKDTINEHGDNDNNLLTRLKEFKPLMDSIVPNYTCTSNYRKHFIIPEKFSENKVTKPENMEQEEETSAHPLVSGTGQEKQQVLESRGQSSNSEVNLLSETLTLGTEEEARGDSRPITETLSQQDLGSYNELSHSGDGRRSVGADSVKVRHLQKGEYTDPLKDPMWLSLRGHSSATDSLGLQSTVGQQSEDPGVLGKMRTAFTDIVQNVDPAPVLGVSGGMGVLFILFKYTPVGSFFGGRRGRFRQIPRSFNGPFPGDFANFQEYGGGFVGYSPMDINPLAE